MNDDSRPRADVSVIMPAYNNQDSIVAALTSIAAQTTLPHEVIVVDDGSTDGTVAAVRSMHGRMNGVRLRLFRQQNNGAGAARNRAIWASTGTWLAFLDADDQWLPTKLERSMAVNFAQDLLMSCHNLYGVGKNGEHVIDSRSRWAGNPGDPYGTLFLRGFISSSTVVVRRDVTVAVGGFDTGLRSAQDYELWLAILDRAGTRFVCFDEPLLRYTLAEDGITSKVGRKIACSLAILRRHMGILKRHGGAVIVPVLTRTAIIQVEAWRNYRAQGRFLAALAQLALLPWRLLEMLVRLPFADGRRPDFLSRLIPAEEVDLTADPTP